MTAPLPAPAAAGLPATPAPTAPGSGAGMDRAKMHKVAQQFEAIFVRQILAEARKTSLDGGENGLFGKQDQTFREMQDARYADIAASKGTFGLARMIEKQLLARSAASAPAPKAGG
jgi:flagellar protein FlgJ